VDAQAIRLDVVGCERVLGLVRESFVGGAEDIQCSALFLSGYKGVRKGTLAGDGARDDGGDEREYHHCPRGLHGLVVPEMEDNRTRHNGHQADASEGR
jgi:hypothetical protein